MAYWQAVAKHAPEVYAQRVALEEACGFHLSPKTSNESLEGLGAKTTACEI
jgi:hypothetical protein